MNVLLLTRYARLGASSRIRCYQYLPHLRAAGIEVVATPLLTDRYLNDRYSGRPFRWRSLVLAYLQRCQRLLRSRRFDLLWIEKELFPWLPAWFEAALSASGIRYIVEYDDAIFHRYDRHPRWIVRSTLGRKIDTVMRRAAAVIVGNEYLRDRASRAGAERIEIIPSVVDLARYPHTVPPSRAGFTVGWIGSPTTARYLRHVAAALTTLADSGGVRLSVVGAQVKPFVGLESRLMVQIVPWSEPTEVAAIHDFDVGIMPLPDGPWERGKCGYKLIQYMACQKPVVASPVGVNSRIVQHGATGFLADSEQEWAEALCCLKKDGLLRDRLGRAGRACVEREYSLQVTAPRLVSLFLELQA